VSKCASTQIYTNLPYTVLCTMYCAAPRGHDNERTMQEITEFVARLNEVGWENGDRFGIIGLRAEDVTPTLSDSQPDSRSGVSGGEIAGIVLGVVFGLLAIGAFIAAIAVAAARYQGHLSSSGKHSPPNADVKDGKEGEMKITMYQKGEYSSEPDHPSLDSGSGSSDDFEKDVKQGGKQGPNCV